MKEGQTVRVLLAGNPNSGKTSLFNALTGGRQHVGNYAGVTVEKREGSYVSAGVRYSLLDLPGTYSLTSYSPEERIAQDEILAGESSVVVTVVDSTTLSRSLVLLAQIMQTGANPVLCLNMADEARKAGQSLDLDLLEALLGFPVVETIAHKGGGINVLRKAIQRAADRPVRRKRLFLGERLENATQEIRKELEGSELPAKQLKWIAGKLLMNDEVYVKKVRTLGDTGTRAIEEAARERARIEAETNMDVSLFISERYYGFVNGLLLEVTRRCYRRSAREVSDRIDSVLAHKALGLPFFLAILYAIFWMTFTLGDYPMGWIESAFGLFRDTVNGFWVEGSDSPIRSLLVDGIIGGVGGVVVFLPNIVLLFIGLAILEDTGYMARAAFLVDNLMHRFGLHGRSFIPMMTGFGCTIPGIMATRTLENDRDRLATMLVLPLMSCGARLPIWMLLIPAFFPVGMRAPMLWFIYMVGVLLALLLALLLRRTLLKGEEAPFVMELPPYRLPTVRGIVRKMLERSWLYLRKAGTVILGISIVMWFFSAYPKPESFVIDREVAAGSVRVVQAESTAGMYPDEVEVISSSDLQNRRLAEELRYSIAGRVGAFVEPAIRPLGFDWKIGTAMIGAVAAKEVFVAQMGIVYALGDTGTESARLAEILREEYSPLVGVSLMLFMLIATPCMATVAVTRRESGSWKWAILQFGGLTGLAYLISLAVYQVGCIFL